jgi:hypothetical protein
MRSYLSVPYDELGEAALQVGINDLYIRETAPNWGPDVQRYLGNVGIDFPAAWCAAAVHSWIKKASQQTGIEIPIQPTGGAQETAFRLKEIDRWIERADASPDIIRPGMVPVWNRGTPEEPWRGHIGLVEYMGSDGDTIHTVEGNMQIPQDPGTEGVARIERSLSEPRLMGFGVLSGPMPWDEGWEHEKPAMIWPFVIGAAAGFAIAHYGLKRAA